jgi:hypothetical protein
MTTMGILNLLRDFGIFGLAMWFIQLLLTKSADRKFESYKTEIDHKTREFQVTLDSKMELYKAELNLQNYKSTQIYERQLNAIIDLHKKLIKLNREMQEMTIFMKAIVKDAESEETERIRKAGESYNEFILFYQDNLIFIPKKTVEQLESIRSDYFNSYHDYTFGRSFEKKDQFTYEMSKEAGNRVKEKIQPALNQLLVDFRHLIGVERIDNI